MGTKCSIRAKLSTRFCKAKSPAKHLLDTPRMRSKPSKSAELILASFPTLKPGVNYLTSLSKGSEIFVGMAHRGIWLDSNNSSETNLNKHLLELCNGSHSLANIHRALASQFGEAREAGEAQEAQVAAEVNAILELLAKARLLEFRRTQLINLQDLTAPIVAASTLNSAKRLRAQENLTTWHPDVSIDNCAADLIAARQRYSIIIFGHNRLALTLFTLLQASGFSAIRLIDRSISRSAADSIQIGPDEVCGLGIRGSDVGVRRELVIADLARNSRLFLGEEKGFPAKPNFIIGTEQIPQETLQRWMSEEIAHLAISNLIENTIEIGPIVIPGRSPCLNCLKLWRSEQYPYQQEFELISTIKSLEIPSAQVAAISGMVAIAVIEYFAALEVGSNSIGKNLVGVTRVLDLFDPMNPDNSVNTNSYWQPHGLCGCQQLI